VPPRTSSKGSYVFAAGACALIVLPLLWLLGDGERDTDVEQAKQSETDVETITPATEPPPAPPPEPLTFVEAPIDSEPLSDRGELLLHACVPSGTDIRDVSLAFEAFSIVEAGFLRHSFQGFVRGLFGISLQGFVEDELLCMFVTSSKHSPDPFALLITVSEPKVVETSVVGRGLAFERQGNFALIGTDPAFVRSIADQAFAVAKQSPPHSELVLYPQPLFDAIRTDLAEALQTSIVPEIVAEPSQYLPAIETIAQYSERIVISVARSQHSGDVFIRVYPRAGTPLAELRDSLHPTEHELVAKLPPLDIISLVSGELQAGPASEFLLAEVSKHLSANFVRHESPASWVERLGPWTDTLDGRFAWASQVELQGPQCVHVWGLFGVRDEDAARAALDTTLDGFAGRFKLDSSRIRARVDREVATHDGVSISRYTMDFGPKLEQGMIERHGYSLPPRQDFAVFDGFVVLGEAETAGALVDSVRGKAHLELSEDINHALANSRALGESLLLWTNSHNPLGQDPEDVPPLTYALGRHGQALSFHLGARSQIRPRAE
jgi:hypothetical protein